MIGIIQATETIKLILGIGNLIDNKILLYDSLNMKFREMNIYSQYTSLQYHKWIQEASYIQNSLINSIYLNSKIPTVSYPIYRSMKQKYKCQLIYIGNYKEIILADQQLSYSLAQLQGSLDTIREFSHEKILVLYCRTQIKSLIASIFLYKNNIHTFVLDITNHHLITDNRSSNSV